MSLTENEPENEFIISCLVTFQQVLVLCLSNNPRIPFLRPS